jgi:hypothetical protein
MQIYHGCPSPKKLERAREEAPNYEHGAQWNPDKMTPHDVPYIVDNGAWSAAHNDEFWEPEPFFKRLEGIEDKMPRAPDFVVLPDVPGEPDVTLEMSLRYAGRVKEFGYDYYLPVQRGVNPEGAAVLANDIDAAGIFVGGSKSWKHTYGDWIASTAHKHGLKCHVGQPDMGDKGLLWADEAGVDSVDTTNIVRNDAWEKLRQLERQDRFHDSIND